MEKVKEFLKTKVILDGNGNGYGNGYGNGHGYGHGYGNGNGDGHGYGHGYGHGHGYGNGNGDGYGNGDGDGHGYGNGNGDGYGNGDGDGNGYGLKSLNNQKIYIIDGLQTIITNVRKNIANGFIVNSDLSLNPCYIAKGENTFAHGETIKKAVASLQEKLLINTPVEQRVEKFKDEFKKFDKKYKAKKFYKWHFYLTGSCEMGRNSFVREHNIDLKNDKLTVNEFVDLVKNSYGGETIKLLLK